MGIAKGLAFFGVVLLGLGLFATVFYQSGLIQKLERNNNTFSVKAVVDTPKKKAHSEQAPLLNLNPDGKTAIAIIRHHRPLENAILDALKEGAFASKF